MKIADQILQVAEEFEGLVEIVSNSEWDDLRTPGKDKRAAAFEEMLKRAGHWDGWPYCMSFCEGVWVTAYTELGAKPAVIARLRTVLSPSVMNSYTNCREVGLISKQPERGAILFMQNGGKWTGHAGLVTDVEPGGWIRTIEANTSPTDANERDGGAGTGGVWRKRRSLNFEKRNSGLWLRGFLNPMEFC
jgi:hypothetical protein